MAAVVNSSRMKIGRCFERKRGIGYIVCLGLQRKKGYLFVWYPFFGFICSDYSNRLKKFTSYSMLVSLPFLSRTPSIFMV